MCSAGIDGMQAVQKTIGDFCEVLGVTVLTSLNKSKCQAIYGCSPEAGVLRFSRMAKTAGLGGLILSPNELVITKNHFELSGLSLNTPAIRPFWSLVNDDDQSRISTPFKAIQAGADRIVVGRPIIGAKDPREAALKTLDEIREGLKKS